MYLNVFYITANVLSCVLSPWLSHVYSTWQRIVGQNWWRSRLTCKFDQCRRTIWYYGILTYLILTIFISTLALEFNIPFLKKKKITYQCPNIPSSLRRSYIYSVISPWGIFPILTCCLLSCCCSLPELADWNSQDTDCSWNFLVSGFQDFQHQLPCENVANTLSGVWFLFLAQSDCEPVSLPLALYFVSSSSPLGPACCHLLMWCSKSHRSLLS